MEINNYAYKLDNSIKILDSMFQLLFFMKYIVTKDQLEKKLVTKYLKIILLKL